ncbi:hypothetical protein [Paraburkholderia sp. MM5477-R1]|uniref:hypothetical protein n=1 Tax=Paraburkholderia sp. MM5477-R1 TaxID=2991062 RepID=UPI003D19206C
MIIYDRPDEDVFAEGAKPGEVADFPNVARGWGEAFDRTGGKPPMEWFNWLGIRTDRAMRYFLQRGVSEWSQTDDYPEGAIVQFDGVLYQAIQRTTRRPPRRYIRTVGTTLQLRRDFDHRPDGRQRYTPATAGREEPHRTVGPADG